MYKVTYYLTPTQGSVCNKNFDTFHEAVQFANKRPNDSIIEIKYYENSDNNGPTLRS
jgi:hypothetical protein